MLSELRYLLTFLVKMMVVFVIIFPFMLLIAMTMVIVIRSMFSPP